MDLWRTTEKDPPRWITPRALETEFSEVLYDVDDHIAVITLNAPERMNTISGPMLNDLTRLLIRANEDPAVRCVILTGNGRAFCAGLDLRKERSGEGLSAASSTTTLDLRNTPPTVLQAMDKPTICAVNGGAAGYGMDTALGCDIRIMAGWPSSRPPSSSAAWCRNPAAPGSCRA